MIGMIRRTIYAILIIPGIVLCVIALCLALPVDIVHFILYDGRVNGEQAFNELWPEWIQSQMAKIYE
jgi:hypothetical protein